MHQYFADQFSHWSNSLNFEAKINLNVTRQNVPKWRKTCTGSNIDLVNFNGPHTNFKHLYAFEWPCSRVHRKTSHTWHYTSVTIIFSTHITAYSIEDIVTWKYLLILIVYWIDTLHVTQDLAYWHLNYIVIVMCIGLVHIVHVRCHSTEENPLSPAHCCPRRSRP